MEILVSGCAGLLCCLSTWHVLARTDAPGGVVISASHVTSPHEAVMRTASAVGSWLQLIGAVPECVAESVAAELRSLRIPVLQSLEGLECNAAVGLVALAGFVSGLLVALLTGSPLGFAVGLALPAVMLAVRIGSRARAERARIEEAMPEAFSALAISLGSGLSLAQAMRYVGSHAEEPVRSAFMRVAFSITCGIPAAEALDAMIRRLHAPGLELVTLALTVSQRTGAPLKELLADAAQLVGDRVDLARKLDVKTSQARMSARLVAGMPIAMIGFLSLLSSDFQKGVATVPGALSIAVALGMNAAAWLVIRRIMNVRL